MQPLEQYLRDYLDAAGGLWDPVEPAVYDVILPESLLGRGRDELFLSGTGGAARVAFDPEAVAEHPGSQFMTLGTPLMDAVLTDGRRRARHARAWIDGLNLSVFDLANRATKSLRLDKGMTIQPGEATASFVTILLFKFEAEFISDQKEQASFDAAVELFHGRPVRQVNTLIDDHRLADQPMEALDSADRVNAFQAYSLARDRVMRTVGTAANHRRRSVLDHCQRQIERMTRYYEDLLAEVDEQTRRAKARKEDAARPEARRRSVEQERDLRLMELRQKSAFRVTLSLTNLIELIQPKLILDATLNTPGRPVEKLSLVWDPAINSLEPLDCPRCHQPGFSLRAPRGAATWLCEKCATP